MAAWGHWLPGGRNWLSIQGHRFWTVAMPISSLWGNAMRRGSTLLYALLLVAAVIGVRLQIIQNSLPQNQNIDLGIYREVGQLLDHGINPYDYTSQLELRERLRADQIGSSNAYIIGDSGRYAYYTSGNLPGSTLLFGAIEQIAQDNPLSWRYALLLGDVFIALAALYFLVRSGVPLNVENLGALSAFVIFYPSLLVWGGVIPQDKQFQTALMILLAARLRGAEPATGVLAALAVGVLGALAVWFKAFGVFLAPVALKYFWPRYRDLIIAAGALTLVSLALVAPFGLTFVDVIWGRATAASDVGATPIHGSPWTLVMPELARFWRPIATGLFVLGALYLMLRRRFDTLNFAAALLVAYVCIWVVNGSMDRQNIAIVFASVCLFTVSEKWARWLIWCTIAAQALVYLTSLALADTVISERSDAVCTGAFLASYFLMMLARACESLFDPSVAALEAMGGSRLAKL